MKKIVISICFLLLALFPLSAQFMQSRGRVVAEKSTPLSPVMTNVYFSWHPVVFSLTGVNVVVPLANAFSLTLTRERSLVPSVPQLYFEYGAGFEYTFLKYKLYSYSDAQLLGKMVTLRIPLTAMYKFQIGETGICIAPFAGFVPYAILRSKYREYYPGETSDTMVYWSDFMLDETGDGWTKKSYWMQLSLIAGARVSWRHFFVASSWEVGLTHIIKDDPISARASQGTISIGVTF